MAKYSRMKVLNTIIDPATTALYLQLGANFIVGPILNPDIARVCNRHKVAYFPGCGSVSEISQAEEMGVEICKIFPGGASRRAGICQGCVRPHAMVVADAHRRSRYNRR